MNKKKIELAPEERDELVAATRTKVAALASRGAEAEIDEDTAAELSGNLSKLFGGEALAKDFLTRLMEATLEERHEMISHLSPDMIEILEQLQHLEQPILQILAYINNTG